MKSDMMVAPAVKRIYTYLLKYGGRVARIESLGPNQYMVVIETEYAKSPGLKEGWYAACKIILCPKKIRVFNGLDYYYLCDNQND